MIDQVTFIVKTFLRPQSINRLVKSICRFYPGNQIIIVNDGDKPIEYNSDNIHCINTDFNIGVSAGRNLAVQHVNTSYLVLMDDDHECTQKTDIAEFCRVQQVTDADIVIGNVPGEKFGEFVVNGDTVKRKPTQLNNEGYCQVHCGSNLFLAKTQVIADLQWDEDLKMLEHWDFFYRAMQAGLKVYYTDRVQIKHHKDKDNNPYIYRKHKTHNSRPSRQIWFNKHGIKHNMFWKT